MLSTRVPTPSEDDETMSSPDGKTTPGRTSIDMSRLNFVWRYEGIGAVLAGMHEKGESWRLFAVWPPPVAQQAS